VPNIDESPLLKLKIFGTAISSPVVRGSPLAVIMGLVDSRTAHTTPRPASTLPSDMPFSGGSYQSRKEPEVVSRSEPRTPRGFFHFPET
jgi:hypothetical protein